MKNEKESFFEFAMKGAIQSLKCDLMYRSSLTIEEILETPLPDPEFFRDNEVRQLVYGRYVPVMEAITISQRKVDRLLNRECYKSLHIGKVAKKLESQGIDLYAMLEAEEKEVPYPPDDVEARGWI